MQRKIITAIILFVVAVSVTLGIISYLTVNESINRSLQDRLMLAGAIANYVEISLQNNLNRLYDISISGKINLKDNNWEPEKQALKTAYYYSLFSGGVFLLDKHGNILITYPQRSSFIKNRTYINYVNQVLEKRPVISNIYTIEPIKKKVIFAMVPLLDNEGNMVGAAGGMLNPTTPFINQLLQIMKLSQNSYIELIDLNEVVIASDNTSHVLRQHDYEGILRKMIKEQRPGIKDRSHGFSRLTPPNSKALDILAVVPLKIAPWGVIIGQAKEEVFAPSIKLQKMFFLLAIAFLGAAIVFAIGLSTSIIKPIRLLISETNRIAAGDLSKPIGNIGADETAILSKSFNEMRIKLAESLESLKNYSVELEKRVLKRTEQIQHEQEKVQTLLKQIITSQEDERKRIARELHDETIQDLSVILMRLDICKIYPEQISEQKIEEIRSIILKTLNEINITMQNLRPMMLDDFGLEAAIKRLLDMHFGKSGINYFYNPVDIKDRRFCPEIEINLLRIAQEAIVNIARHAEAENVFVIIKANSTIYMDIEDDGEGFNIVSLLKKEKIFCDAKNNRGLGLLGIKERALLIGGNVEICSMPGCGTKVSLRVPLTTAEVKDV